MKKIPFEMDLNTLANLLQSNELSTAQCNQLYVDAIRKQSIGELVPTLKLLSPYCGNIGNLPSKFKGEAYFDAIKYILLDKKYSNYDWIVSYLDNTSGFLVNKTDILRFILSSNFDSDLIESIKFVVFAHPYLYDTNVMLQFVDKIDAKSLNEKDESGSTVIYKLLAKNHRNSDVILERAISNGYDVNLPIVFKFDLSYVDWQGQSRSPKELTALEYYFLLGIGFERINDDDTKNIVYLLLKNSALSKEVTDNVINIFYTKAKERGSDINFFKYINSVCGDHSDFPTFFFENYPNEVAKNDCHNLLPKEVKDIFVF